MNKLIIYQEFPDKIKRDYMYSVHVAQGNEKARLPVYNHTVKGTTSENPICVDNFRRFATFGFCGDKVRVDIKVNRDFKCYSVLPSAKSFKHCFDKSSGVISVYLDKPDYFLVRLDEDDSTILSVLADEQENYNFDEENTIRVEGWYEPKDKNGYLTITEPNTTIYIAPGAILNARIDILCDDVKVIGRGAMLDPFANIYEYDQSTAGNNWFLHTKKNHVIIDGIHLLDARCFQIGINGNNNVVSNVKMLSTMMCSDGITFSAGEENIAEHCFIYNSDNCMVFSASNTVYRDMTVGTTCCAIYAQGSPHNVLLENIHIFRADSKDSGIIRNIYNPTRTEQSMSVTVKNLDAVDCTILSGLFLARGIGRLNKSFELYNISLKRTNIEKPLLTVINNDGDVYTDNYRINMRNVAINSKVLTKTAEIGTDFQKASENCVMCTSDGKFVPIEHEVTFVDYTNENTVKATLPNGGENILSDDSGIISEYANLPSWCLYINAYKENGNTVYRALNHSMATYSSIIRMLDEEVKKYGAGSYVLELSAKGSHDGRIKVIVRNPKRAIERCGIYDVKKEWTNIKLDFEVLADELDDASLCLRIMSFEKAIESFEICNVTLKKL